MNTQAFDTVITSDRGQFGFRLKTIRKYWDLIWLFVRRDLINSYKQSILGPVWIVISPLMTSVVFTVVFGNMAGIAADGLPRILFYLAGNTMWGLFSKCVTTCSNVFVTNRQLYNKIYFPRIVSVISTAMSGMISFLIQFAMLLIFFVIYAVGGEPIGLSFYWLLIPVLVVQAMMLGASVGMIVASLSVKYKDFIFMMTLLLPLWMYATPIVYPLTSQTGLMRALLLANPMTAVVQNFRYALYMRGELLLWQWGVSAAVTLLLFVLAVGMFSRAEKDMIDMV